MVNPTSTTQRKANDMTSKTSTSTSKTSTAAPSTRTRKTSTQPSETIAEWVVKGRGKASRQYLAAVPTSVAAGTRVKLTSKAGVVTYATLTECVATEGNANLWTIAREEKTAEEKAHDRALRAAATAAYWDSEKGRETQQRIQARAERKAQDAASKTQPSKDAAGNVSVRFDQPSKGAKTQPSTQPATQPSKDTAPSADDLKALAAAMRDAGYTATEVLKALSDLKAQS